MPQNAPLGSFADQLPAHLRTCAVQASGARSNYALSAGRIADCGALQRPLALRAVLIARRPPCH
eukprot:7420408-Alexandrium_andersonii.AAC.1